MTSVERVKSICKERKIPISRLERDLEFANGYINHLRKGMFPADRLAKIARYLNLSEEFLLTGQEKEKAPTTEDERIKSKNELKAAFLAGTEDLPEEDRDELWDDAWEYYQYRVSLKRKKRNGE